MSGSQAADLNDLAAVPVPEYTRSHRPMPYPKMVGYVKHLIDKTIGAPVVREQYALNKEGHQMFGEMALDVGEKDLLSIGLRSSYNKSVAAGLVAGKHIMVCDNLQFHGAALKLVRKNTTNVWRDFERLAASHVHGALGHFESMQESDKAMKALPVSEERGFALLGVARGRGVLNPTQTSVAFQDWKTPRHEEFAQRNLWGLYQAVTEGLKKGAPVQRIDRQTKAHDFFEGWL